MLNKQPNDPDVAGIGAFVEENFFNIGIGDHPVQALNALARGHLDPTNLAADGFPYHAEDTGREEVTHNPNDAFLTVNLHREGISPFDILQPAYAALISGAFHPTAEGHAIVADHVMRHVRALLDKERRPVLEGRLQ